MAIRQSLLLSYLGPGVGTDPRPEERAPTLWAPQGCGTARSWWPAQPAKRRSIGRSTTMASRKVLTQRGWRDWPASVGFTTCLCFALHLEEQKQGGFHRQYSNYQIE